jgi:hypothetical protein
MEDELQLGTGGYHFQRPDHVNRFIAREQARAEERIVVFETLLGCLPTDTDLPLHFVDLGAGDGKVAEAVFNRYPKSTAILVEFSDLMIEKGKEALASFGDRYQYFNWDMNLGDWPSEFEGPFDAVVSSLAIHHLNNERKLWLATAVFDRLLPNGIFANYDRLRDPLISYGEDEAHDRTCATLDEARDLLVRAGYSNVTVPIRNEYPKPDTCENALLIARKGTSDRAA